MPTFTYASTAKLFEYPGEMGNWYFLSLPKEASRVIQETHKAKAAGFGSIRVQVTLNESVWQTSIFPDRRAGTYLLPVKAKIRKENGLFAGDTVEFKIQIL